MRPKKVILCVDDNEQELSVMKFMLVTNGYRVLAAKNGQEAIELFTENAVDLVPRGGIHAPGSSARS